MIKEHEGYRIGAVSVIRDGIGGFIAEARWENDAGDMIFDKYPLDQLATLTAMKIK